MALTVTSANPGKISSVGVAQPSVGPLRVTQGNGFQQTVNPQGPTYNPQQAGGVGSSGYAPGGLYTGGGGSGGAAAAPVDPYNSDQHAFLDALNGAIGNIEQNGADAFGTANRTLQGQSDSLFNKVQTGQKGVDRARENVELNRLNGIRDVLGFVRNGLQSAGTRLSNMNALDSSGADAFARAYGQIGNQKSRAVGNSAFLAGRDVDTQQDQVDLTRTQGITDFQRLRDEQVASIGSSVRQQLAQLDQQAAGLSLPGRVAVDAEKNKIISAGQAQLNALDAALQGRVGGVKAEGTDAVRQTARQLQTAGTAGNNPFDVGLDNISTSVSGPAISQLPLFVRSKKQS
jgi:hypothetical protein